MERISVQALAAQDIKKYTKFGVPQIAQKNVNSESGDDENCAEPVFFFASVLQNEKHAERFFLSIRAKTDGDRKTRTEHERQKRQFLFQTQPKPKPLTNARNRI